MKKGLTLVEVLVSITVFVISFATCITVYFTVLKYENKQHEYLAFENICLEIDKYSDTYKGDWNIEYFGNENNVQYYDEKFNHLTGDFDFSKAKYQLVFSYEKNLENKDELVIDIFEIESSRYIIQDLNYGGARYE